MSYVLYSKSLDVYATADGAISTTRYVMSLDVAKRAFNHMPPERRAHFLLMTCTFDDSAPVGIDTRAAIERTTARAANIEAMAKYRGELLATLQAILREVQLQRVFLMERVSPHIVIKPAKRTKRRSK